MNIVDVDCRLTRYVTKGLYKLDLFAANFDNYPKANIAIFFIQFLTDACRRLLLDIGHYICISID